MLWAFRLPVDHINWLTEKGCTCNDYLRFLELQMRKTNDPVTRGALHLADVWVIGVSQQSANDTNSSILVMGV